MNSTELALFLNSSFHFYHTHDINNKSQLVRNVFHGNVDFFLVWHLNLKCFQSVIGIICFDYISSVNVEPNLFESHPFQALN